MSKELQLLKHAVSGSNSRIENILKGKTNPLKRWLSRDRLEDVTEEEIEISGRAVSPPPILRRPSLPVILHKEKSAFVDVDCRDENGQTPLSLAALNGHKDIVSTLISFSADVHAKDKQGNCGLHMAAWQNLSDIVELLLLNGASPIATNNDGNTPLHYACQYCTQGKTLSIIKLLQYDSSVLLANNAGDTPLDLAIRYNKQEAVAVLVDADPETLKSTKTIIEAATKGRREVIAMLLDAGMDPNCFDSDTGNMPLHEAVRYFRKDVAEVLLSYGGQCGLRNGQSESVIDIINKHPDHRQKDFFDLINKYRGQRPKVTRAQMEKTRGESFDVTFSSHNTFSHRLLTNRKYWLKNNKDHCSAATKKYPVTNVFDGDSCSYWLIPAPGAYNWIAFDFGSQFTLTGVRIHGWGNKTMIYSFSVECSDSINGPWTSVGKYKADLLGPEDMLFPPEGQDFKGFYATSQFWRIVIADNYGDTTTAVASIQFYGFEVKLLSFFEELNLPQYIKLFAEKGFNQLSELAIASDEILKTFVFNASDRQKIIYKARTLRAEYFPPANLRWAIPPQRNVTAHKPMPDFSVMSDPYTVGELVLQIQSETGQIINQSSAPLLSKDNGFLSCATFSNICISQVGTCTFEVQSKTDTTVLVLLDKPVIVDPPPKRHSEIDRMFADFDDMMSFDNI